MSVSTPSDETITALGSTYRVLTYGEEVTGAYSALEEEFWGDTTPLHRHPGAEEAFHVRAGRLEVWADGVITEATEGAFVVIPRGVAHALRRLSDEPVRMLTLISPPGVERIFAAVVEQGEDELLADPERLIALAAQHGTEILGDHPLA